MEQLAQQLPEILYSLFCCLAVLCSIFVITVKNPVSSAFSLILVLLNVAALFAMQEAHFVAAVQVLVYAGAIMVLFVFVIMLLSIEAVELDFKQSKLAVGSCVVVGLVFFATITTALIRGGTSPAKGNYTLEAIQSAGGNIRVISEVMFSDYMFSFQVVAIVLMLAVVGAIVLAKRKVE